MEDADSRDQRIAKTSKAAGQAPSSSRLCLLGADFSNCKKPVIPGCDPNNALLHRQSEYAWGSVSTSHRRQLSHLANHNGHFHTANFDDVGLESRNCALMTKFALNI